MDTLRAMQVYVAVARHGGFAPAAKEMGLSTSSVSRHVANLEDNLGAQLFTRTTRHLRLTQAGEELLGQCQRLVHEVDDLVQTARRDPTQPRGRLRVTMPGFLGTILMQDVIAQFAVDNPAVDLELVIIDRIVNLVEEGFDLAIRTGPLPDSSLIARKFLDMRLALVGSPDYFGRQGKPRQPADLREHNCIIDTVSPYGDKWPLSVDGSARRVPVRGSIRVNSGAAARNLAIGGAGLTLLPDYLVHEAVQAGKLETVLDDHLINDGGIYIVYPQSRHPSSAVRSFADLLIEHSKPIRNYRNFHEENDGGNPSGKPP